MFLQLTAGPLLRAHLEGQHRRHVEIGRHPAAALERGLRPPPAAPARLRPRPPSTAPFVLAAAAAPRGDGHAVESPRLGHEREGEHVSHARTSQSRLQVATALKSESYIHSSGSFIGQGPSFLYAAGLSSGFFSCVWGLWANVSAAAPRSVQRRPAVKVDAEAGRCTADRHRVRLAFVGLKVTSLRYSHAPLGTDGCCRHFPSSSPFLLSCPLVLRMRLPSSPCPSQLRTRVPAATSLSVIGLRAVPAAALGRIGKW